MLATVGRLYLFLCLCLGMFGCMASTISTLPRSAGPDSAEAGRHYAESSGIADATSSDGGDGSSTETRDGSIVLDRHGDGHFYADVAINGTTIEMMVDTGASGVALSENDARRAGIATSIGMRDAVGEGAGGTVYGDVIAIDRISLGPVEANGLPAVVLKGGEMSLLGQQFLRKFAHVEIEGDRMVLSS